MAFAANLRRQVGDAIRAIEPWYDWGRAGITSVRDEIDGNGWCFTVDWLGVHVSLMFGRTPTKGER